MAGLDGTGEIIMAIEIPVSTALNKPAAAAGAAGHITGDGDHRAAGVLPEGTSGAFAGFSCLAVEGIARRIPIGIVSLLDRLIIGPAGSSNHVGQIAPAIGSDNGHAVIVMQVAEAGVEPIGRNF